MAASQNSRLDLHAILKTVCNNVYHDPPESLKLNYPCIVYYRSKRKILNADNINYAKTWGYDVTIISKNADDQLYESLENALNKLSFINSYTADGLHHWLYLIYY